jgi:hypothetical protein
MEDVHALALPQECVSVDRAVVSARSDPVRGRSPHSGKAATRSARPRYLYPYTNYYVQTTCCQAVVVSGCGPIALHGKHIDQPIEFAMW